VTAQDLSTKTYTLDFTTAAASTDATLSALTYTVGEGSPIDVPNFSASTETYSIELPYGTATNAAITLVGTVNDENASVTTNEGVTLSEGAGQATIVVTAQDNETTKTYTLNFTTAAASTDATLSALTYKIGDGEAIDVSNFSTSTETYNIELPYGTATGAAITLVGTVNDENASVTTNEGVTLSEGAGQATIVVTAQDNETTKTYTLNFTTAAASTYAVSGTVSAGETEASAEGITVNLYAAVDTSYETSLGNGTTNASGEYSINNKVEAGSYVVVVAASEGSYAQSTAEVSVTDGAVTNADITLVVETPAPTTYAVSGTVSVGETEASVEGITVNLYAAADTSYETSLGNGTTNASGEYSINNEVEAGSYVVVVAASEGSYAQSTAEVTVTDGAVTDANITLVAETPAPALTISGVIVTNTTNTSGTFEIGDILTATVEMSDGEAAGNRVVYFAVVQDSENSIDGISILEDSNSNTFTIPATYQNSEGQTVSIIGKYIDFGAVVVDDESTAKAGNRVGPITTNVDDIADLIIAVSNDGTISGNTDTGTVGASFSYFLVSESQQSVIDTWNVETSADGIAAALEVSTQNGEKPTLAFSDNGKYLVVVEIKDSKVVAAGQSAVIDIDSPYTIAEISTEATGGAGITRTITTTGIDGSQYLVVQITEGTGADAHVSVVMVKAEDCVTISYKTTATVQAWLTDGMPTLSGSDATGATIYDTASSN
jgi:hypothetical protein